MSKKPTETSRPTVIDPDNISESLCEGPFNIFWNGDRTMLTFTHQRLRPNPLFIDGTTQFEIVVRARISMSKDNLLALRDLLTRLFPPNEQETPSPTGSAASALH